MDFAPRRDKVEGRKTRRGKAESEKVDGRKVNPIRINTIYTNRYRYSKDILLDGFNTHPKFKANPDFVSCFYDDENKSFDWKLEYKKAVKKAIETAVNNLTIALSDEKIKDNNVMKNAILEVISILKDPELKIYPLDDEKCCGMAEAPEIAISININLLSKSPFALAKTLIHEAFHIIGGCCSNEIDEPCSDYCEKFEALKKIRDCMTIKEMCADAFAQFVMKR